MIMKQFGEFLLRKNANAIAVAFLAALLPLFSIPIGFVAVVIVALVTLQKGPIQGLWILAWVALPALALLVLKQVGPVDFLLIRCVLIWLLAAILYRYQTWELLL